MSESGKITASHLSRAAVIYVRQSTLVQVERNTESTARQYDLVSRARQLGWPREAIRVVDGDLGISGSVTGQRDGFEGMVAEVALGQVGIILALEVSRLARDNAAWYRMLDLAGVCDTLVADADGVYHPALFNDRLILGMKGIMAESELHVLRARLEGGIKNKAARGELRRGLPAGLIWGEGDGEICFHPDEAVTGVIAAVFEQFAVCGSVRATWLWLREQGLRWPLQQAVYLHGKPGEITWVEPTYHAVHSTLTHPAYAGAYVYGRTRDERYLGPDGALRKRRRKLPRDQWEVLIPDHHPGFTDWDTYLANQARIGGNIRPQASQPGTGAVREGSALLQGLATCGSCGRKLSAYELTCRDRYGKTCRAVQPERQSLTRSAASVARVAPVRSGNGQGRLSRVPGHRDLLRSAPDVQVRSCIPVVAGVDHGTRTAISARLPVPGNARGPVRRHKLAIFYRGPAKTVPNYYCQGSADLVNGRGSRHMNVGGQAIDAAVAAAFLAALQPVALQACLQAAEQLEQGHDAALDQHRRQVEQARYQAVKAERRYRAVDPENRLVARGLETEWNTALQQAADAEAELTRRQSARPKSLTPAERAAILALGGDLGQVWDATTTTDKDRKQLLRTLLEEVNITACRDDPGPHARLVLRWKGGAITELTVPLRRPQPKIRTDDNTVNLVRRLAVHYPDAKIAGILNRQGRRTPLLGDVLSEERTGCLGHGR